MTTNKDLKRLVRTRMKKTGESYTAARTQLSKKKPTVDDASTRSYAELAGMTDTAVRAKTGKNWKQWVVV